MTEAEAPTDQWIVMVIVRLPVRWMASPAAMGGPPSCVAGAEPPSDPPRDRPSLLQGGPAIAASRPAVPTVRGKVGVEGRQNV
jgi:hypothetical protein